jgi:sporulation protein YlmC with PRC-barrel domain
VHGALLAAFKKFIARHGLILVSVDGGKIFHVRLSHRRIHIAALGPRAIPDRLASIVDCYSNRSGSSSFLAAGWAKLPTGHRRWRSLGRTTHSRARNGRAKIPLLMSVQRRGTSHQWRQIMKHHILGCCIALALASPVLAQTATPSQTATPALTAAPSSQTNTDWRSSKLVGTTVYNKANENIGEVADIVIGSDGAVSAVIVSVGGFLGVGEKHVAMPFKALKASRNESNSLTLSVDTSKEKLTSMPAYTYFKA